MILRRNADAVCAVLLFSITLILYYPGQMSQDSLEQFAQVLSGEYIAWYSPVMTALWRLLNHVVYGPAGMLVFQNLLFWTALLFFARLLSKKISIRCLIVFLLGIWPPIFAQLGVIGKDTHHSAAMFLASVSALWAARIFHGGPTRRKRLRLVAALAVVPLWYAVAVRYNAVPGILPMTIWLAYLWFEKRRRAGAVWIGLVLLFIMVATAWLLNESLTNVHGTVANIPLMTLLGLQGEHGCTAWSHGFYDGYFKPIMFMHDPVLFRGWPYFALAIVLVFFGIVRWSGSVFFVSASGLIYGLAYLPFGAACDFRNIYWTVLSSIMAVLLAVLRPKRIE